MTSTENGQNSSKKAAAADYRLKRDASKLKLHRALIIGRSETCWQVPKRIGIRKNDFRRSAGPKTVNRNVSAPSATLRIGEVC